MKTKILVLAITLLCLGAGGKSRDDMFQRRYEIAMKRADYHYALADKYQKQANHWQEQSRYYSNDECQPIYFVERETKCPSKSKSNILILRR